MKTIEKAALNCNKEYSLQPAPAYLGFIQGVKFAQRWIPVEEELPEKSKQVIAKLENGWHTCTWITEDGTFAYNIKPTHWRYIDLK